MNNDEAKKEKMSLDQIMVEIYKSKSEKKSGIDDEIRSKETSNTKTKRDQTDEQKN